jgi:gliding motility-associated-like protein
MTVAPLVAFGSETVTTPNRALLPAVAMQFNPKPNFFPGMLKILTLFIFTSSLCFGQMIENASFEGPLATSAAPPGWTDCNLHSTADTQPGSWLVDKAPSDGSSYTSLVTRGRNNTFNDGFTEAVSTQLLETFQPGGCYRLTLDLAFFGNFDGGWPDSQGTWGPAKLKVWASTGACTKNQLLWESDVISHQDWQSYTVGFTTDQAYSHLILEAGYTGSDIHNGNILIDNLRMSKYQVDVGDVLLCRRGDAASLRVDAPGASVEWSTGATEDSIVVSEPGRYWVKVAQYGCEVTDEFTVGFKPPLRVNLGGDVTGCTGDSVVLDATIPGGKYAWSTGSTDPAITVRTPGTYHVRVEDECGYTGEDEIEITFAEQCCLITAPNVFTPNGDNRNDFFQVSAGTNISRYKLRVHNRWGKLVYESNDLTRFWDGRTPDGQEAATGVYFWRIDILCNRSSQASENSFKGTLTLLR